MEEQTLKQYFLFFFLSQKRAFKMSLVFYHNGNEKPHSVIEIACFLLCSTLCPEMLLGMELLICGSLTKHLR